MTIEALAHRGVHVERPAPGEWVVPAGALRGKDLAIEPDLSNAAPFLAAAMVDRRIGVGRRLARALDAARRAAHRHPLAHGRARHRAAAARSPSPQAQRITGVDLDLSAAGELTPTIFGLAAFADAPTTLYGIGHIRGHETDRIAALVGELRALGGEAHELPDGIRIVPQPLHGGTLARPPRPPAGDDGCAHRSRRAGRRDRRHQHDRQDDARVPAAVGATRRRRVGRRDPAARRRCRHRELAGRGRRRRRTRVRRSRHPDPAESESQPPPHEAAPGPRRRPARPRARASIVAATSSSWTRTRRDEHEAVAMRARELRDDSRSSRATVRASSATARVARGRSGRIVGIEERTSLLRRSADDTDQVERVVVANADQMLVVVAAADPEPRPRLVDRYLVAALDAGIRPLLVVTKIDLADPAVFLTHFEGLDLEVFTSAQDEMPLDRIGAALVGHSTVFVGHSGVGKSTLVNALVPDAHRATGHVNVVTGRGRHTSSSTVSLRYRVAGRQRLGHRHARRAIVRSRPCRPREHPARLHRSRRDRRGVPARLHPPSGRAGLRDDRGARGRPPGSAGRGATRLAATAARDLHRSAGRPRLSWTDDHRATRTGPPRPRLHPPRPGRAARRTPRPPRAPGHPVLLSGGDDTRVHEGGLRLPRQPRAPAGRRLHDARHLPRRCRRSCDASASGTG